MGGYPQNSAVFRCMTQVFLVFVFTTLLLMMYVARVQHDEMARDSVIQAREDARERMRLQRLRELQRTIFVNPRRPADSTYNINVTLSERIPLERQINDSRPKQCRDVKYDLSTLPSLTVIIPFYNEALSMLLRTVHSVLMRTPPSLLREVILVNDHSPNEDLWEPLERYVKLLPRNVHLLRTKKREGLIRARLIGAKMASGEVLFFQDAHTEANVQWAEPLLQEIAKDPHTVIQPHVDQIEASTIEYLWGSSVVPRGGFSWDLRYVWMEMPEHEKKRLNYRHDYVAHRTPTLVGCALAVRKDYFFAIGGFDDDMNIWGGENIELGFRTWLCHGQVLTHPCSRVAHTFKPFSYQFDGDREKIVQKNLMRTAELWMDDHKKFFLASTYSWPAKHTYFTDSELASLQRRKNMKRNLQCRTFQWYLDTIIPEVPTPPIDAVFYGEVTNLRTDACLFAKSDGYIGMTYFCYFHRVLPGNLFEIDQEGRLLYRQQCVRIDYKTWLLRLGACEPAVTPSEHWETILHFNLEGIIRVTFPSGKGLRTMCVTQVTNINKLHYMQQMPQLLDCDQNNQFQKFRWTYKFNFHYNWDTPASVDQRL